MGLADKLIGKAVQNAVNINPVSLSDFLDDDVAGLTTFNINTKVVTREQAEKLAVVNMGVNLISEAIAEMPIYLYKRNADGSREKVKNDKRNRLLNMDNGSYSNAYNMKKNLITDYIYHGNGYLDIERDNRNNIMSLIHIPYRDVNLLTSNDINKRNTVYKYQYWGMDVQTHNVLNLVRNPKYDQMVGYGLLDDGQLTLASLMAIEDFMNSNAESGFTARAVITKDTVMSQASRKSLLDMLARFFGGANSNKNGGVLLLDDGMKFQQLTQSSKELELLDQKELLIKDVARLLKLPLPIIGIATSGMTYSNEQQLKMTLLKQTLMPIIRNLEETFNKYLLTEKEKENYFFEFDYSNILKVSPQEEINAYGSAIGSGLMLVDEARRKMNLPPLPKENQSSDNVAYNSEKLATQVVQGQDDNLKGGEADESGSPK